MHATTAPSTPLLVHTPTNASYAWSEEQFSPTTDMYNASPAHSPAHTTTTASDSTGSEAGEDTALALRRQRNRESMRRTRQKSKEAITQFRATLTRLETQYARLMAPWNDPTDPLADDNERRQFHADLQAKLQSLVAMRRSLEAENVAVQKIIEQKEELQNQLQTILDANALDEMINEKLALLESSCTKPKEGFTSLTVAQSVAMIDDFCNELHRVKCESQMAMLAGTSPPQLEVFGWQARRHVDVGTNHMHFEFVKVFDHVDAYDMTHRAWTNGMDVEKFRATERQLNIRRLDFLQHVTADTKVMVREIVHPVDGTIFRTNYLAFKKPVRDGFLVGMTSINPSVEDQQEHAVLTGEKVMWIDVKVNVELVARGPYACQVSWRGSTNYKSPQYAAESAVKFLMGVLRWEQMTIGPLLQFSF